MGGTNNVSSVSNLTPEQSAMLKSMISGYGGATTAKSLGDISINPYSQKALDFIKGMGESRTGLSTMTPASDYYGSVLKGDYGAESKNYQDQVIGSVKDRGEATYSDMSKALATHFSDKGGYFGGRHAMAQEALADDSARGINDEIATLKYNQYNRDLDNKAGAASGLTTVGANQNNILSTIAQLLVEGGNIPTQIEQLNRQNRMNLLGVNAITPVVTQDNSLASLLGGAGQLGTAGLLKALGIF